MALNTTEWVPKNDAMSRHIAQAPDAPWGSSTLESRRASPKQVFVPDFNVEFNKKIHFTPKNAYSVAIKQTFCKFNDKLTHGVEGSIRPVLV